MNHLRRQRDTTAHDHTHVEWAFIMDGQAKHYTMKGVGACSTGSIYIIPPGVWHGYAACSNLEIYNCLLSPRMIMHEMAHVADEPGFVELFPTSPDFCRHSSVIELSIRRPAISQLRASLEGLHEVHRNPRATKAALLSRILDLADLLSRRAKLEFSPTPATAFHPSVRRALALLHSDLSRTWNLSELADLLSINPNYLVRLFHRQVGHPPLKYLSMQRVEKAATLLVSSRRSIGEIAREVGWNDPKQFCLHFKKRFGKSAGAYRRELSRIFHR